MLNGICDPKDDNKDAFANKVKYSIIWECEDTLRDVLRETGLNREGRNIKAEVLKDALIDAIARNNFPAVKVLFDDLCVSLDQFDVSLRLRKTKDILKMDDDDFGPILEKYTLNSGSWFQLLSRIKRLPSSGGAHVHVLKMGVKETRGFSARDSRLHDAKTLKKERSEKLKPTPQDLHNEQTEAELHAAAQRSQSSFLVAKYEKRLLLYERIYKKLLGDNFCYHIGCMGPELDLFFLNVLYNRMEIAEVFWRRSPLPITSAISAAYLLREMAKRDGVEPAVRILMLENAYLFEKMAVGVMKAAQKGDRQFATLALDCVVNCRFLWMDTTILDLAMQSNCRDFVQECCREAIDARMYGDIDPYQNSPWWIFFNVFPLCGLWAAIGSRFPNLKRCAISFKIPPVDDVVRNSTHRRKTPLGYPDQPNKNPKLKSLSCNHARCDAAYPSKVRIFVCRVPVSITARTRREDRRGVCACLCCVRLPLTASGATTEASEGQSKISPCYGTRHSPTLSDLSCSGRPQSSTSFSTPLWHG
jgi:hypothetical protein